jgi:hypothetical protein
LLHDNNNASTSYFGSAGTSADWNNIKFGTAGDVCTIPAPYNYTCPTAYLGINVAGGKNPVLWTMNGLTDVVTYQIYGTAIKHCGTSVYPCMDLASSNNAHGYSGAGTIDVENSVFDTTSVIGKYAAIGSGSAAITHLTWTGNREVNDITGFLGINANTFLTTSGSCVITGNFFDLIVGGTLNDPFGGCLLTGNFFSHSFGAAQSATHPWGSFTGNFHSTSSGLATDQKVYVPITQNVFYEDWAGNTGSNHIGFFAADGGTTYTVVGNICAVNTTASLEGHCATNDTAHTSSPANAYVLDNLSVMTATGNSSGSWFGELVSDSPGGSLVGYVDHNSVNGSGAAQGWGPYTGHGSTYDPTNAVWQTYRANIGWAPNSGSNNFQIKDLNQALSGAGSTPSTMTNGSTVIDWNDSYNGTASTLFATGVDANCATQGSNPYYGTVYQICATSGGPGAHESTANPKYIDTSRTPDTWAAKVMGQTSSITGVRAAVWGCASVPSCIGNMYAWIQRGWQPTNIALKGAAHDGKIIGFAGTLGSGYSGSCGVTITPQDVQDLGGTIPAHAASATCTFVGGVPQITITNGGAHYRIANPATVAIACGGCTPTVAASLTPIVQPSDIGAVPMVVLPSAF